MSGYNPETGHFGNLEDAVAACKALRDGGQPAFDAECDRQLAREARKREEARTGRPKTPAKVIDLMEALKAVAGASQERGRVKSPASATPAPVETASRGWACVPPGPSWRFWPVLGRQVTASAIIGPR